MMAQKSFDRAGISAISRHIRVLRVRLKTRTPAADATKTSRKDTLIMELVTSQKKIEKNRNLRNEFLGSQDTANSGFVDISNLQTLSGYSFFFFQVLEFIPITTGKS